MIHLSGSNSMIIVVLLVLYRGPVLIGYLETDFVSHSDISTKGQPEPSGWLISGVQDLGLDHFHLGVLCFIGNCMCMDAFVSIQLALANASISKMVSFSDHELVLIFGLLGNIVSFMVFLAPFVHAIFTVLVSYPLRHHVVFIWVLRQG
ncbi:hypothetical protein JHK87_039708 [Glycine soja]|nr:hypothetical protein JHK87_039708 [Glycine soja]